MNKFLPVKQFWYNSKSESLIKDPIVDGIEPTQNKITLNTKLNILNYCETNANAKLPERQFWNSNKL